jgi:hypothetical protein
MGYGKTDAIDRCCYGLLFGANILGEQCSVGPISGIGFGMDY